ncbi:MAG: hypothetical protein PVF49_10480 [Anaerolineales bacterium]|jgi:hypothetical protein
MDKAVFRSWLRFVAELGAITLVVLAGVYVLCLIIGWTEPDQYFSILFYVSAALILIGGYSIQSSWSGIRRWTYAMGQTASEDNANERAKSEIRDINQALGVWGKLSLVGALLLAITLIVG